MIRPVLQVWTGAGAGRGGAGRVWPMCSVTRCQVRGRTSHLDTEESSQGAVCPHYTIQSTAVLVPVFIVCTAHRCVTVPSVPAITSHRVTIRDSPHQHAGSRDKIHRLLTQKNFRRINYPPLAPAPPLKGGGGGNALQGPQPPPPHGPDIPPVLGRSCRSRTTKKL